MLGAFDPSDLLLEFFLGIAFQYCLTASVTRNIPQTCSRSHQAPNKRKESKIRLIPGNSKPLFKGANYHQQKDQDQSAFLSGRWPPEFGALPKRFAHLINAGNLLGQV